MTQERWLSEEEVSELQDRIDAEKPRLLHKEYTEDGFELYYRLNDGKMYRLCHDHETWCIGAFEGEYTEY